jgi:hypothetical protein
VISDDKQSVPVPSGTVVLEVTVDMEGITASEKLGIFFTEMNEIVCTSQHIVSLCILCTKYTESEKILPFDDGIY